MGEKHFFLLVGVLYAGVCLAGGWVVTPADRRQMWRSRITEANKALWRRLGSSNENLAYRLLGCRTMLRAGFQSGCDKVMRHKGAASATLALLTLPALFAIALSSHTQLEGYTEAQEPIDPVVTALLRGEQLVPPPQLPPDVFRSRDLELLRPEISGASREWTLLDSEFRRRLLAVFQLMARHGYQMTLIEGYRSAERQAHLARLGPQVTNAGAYQSYHQYGLAADSAFYRDGKVVISEHDEWAMAGYRLYGKYAESAGLVWGGRWQMMDFGHVELRKSGVLGRR